ncbi:UDP-galactopyranose mutase [Pokkaliibacter plantistimulans]|uniref:UDP-galactopyranose mutase n=1 Tax=Pokkaliibacter plantistimulans TaxID=1635171 RepID=A0ABX5M668_9GAMM|nr:UDP-galactopyranose mutase [Pokkaliibacter plantistimulans]PXF32385.1 UDP-galactopyranose mutase [Pokkaliibacter plantistimulans]
MKPFDVIVVGAGISGAVIAERMASQLDLSVLVIDQRGHIGGNCFDELDADGIRIHRYGPHLFHTDRENVWQYLSSFTRWQPYEHRVLSSIDGELVPIPFNLTSIERCFPEEKARLMIDALIARFGEEARVPILELRKEADPLLAELADFIYQKAFVNYTSKQWGVAPEAISPAVTARVPVVVSRDDRYFTDPWQALPAEGYTAMFRSMLDQPTIEVRLNTPMSEVLRFDWQHQHIYRCEAGAESLFKGKVIYTGMIDQLFAADQGALRYRSLRFSFERKGQSWWQPATTVNYPNEHEYTRITEFRHLMKPEPAAQATTVVYEFPKEFDPTTEDEPYYPVFTEEGQRRFKDYAERAQAMSQLHCLGRLAQYKYFDMDDAVANALETYHRLRIEYA